MGRFEKTSTFIDGKFVGGCDIVTEMYDSGDLQKVLEQAESRAS